MTTSVRIGFIGTSWWMNMAHLPIFQADSRVELVAICGRNRDRAQEMATKYGIPNVFTDYRDMIENANLDAIVIGTPDDEHFVMTMDALDAGLHVLCEKPLAMNAGDAEAMYQKAEAQGVVHMTFYTYRWLPHYRYLHELIKQGAIGRVYHCQFRFLMGFGRHGDYRWRFDRKRANGIVGDSGSHMFDLARHLVGDISHVSAHLETHIKRESSSDQPLDAANDSAMILLKFADGAQGVVQVSAVARLGNTMLEQQVTIHGDAGSVVAEFTTTEGPKLQMAKGDDPIQPIAIPEEYFMGIDQSQHFIPQFASMFTHQPIGCRLFIDAILEQQPVSPSFFDGWQAQLLIDAALAAHETAEWVAVVK